MTKINLSRALKMKNRLVGDINRLKGIIIRDNSSTVIRQSGEDIKALYDELGKKIETLGKLKASISIANANSGVYEKLTAMEELKSLLGFIETLPTKHGKYEEAHGYNRDKVIVEYVASIRQSDVDQVTCDLQNKINELQDGVDDLNAKTLIEID